MFVDGSYFISLDQGNDAATLRRSLVYIYARAHTVRGRESEHNIYTYRIRTCIVKARNDTVDESCGGVWRLPSKEQPSKKKTTITVLFTSTARGAYL